MYNEALKFNVGSLIESTTGVRDLYSFEGPVLFDGINTKSIIKGKLELMRIDDGINVKVSNVEIKVSFRCSKCLKNYIQKIIIKMAERQFLLKEPTQVDDPADLFLIDRKALTIDLTEGLRQEIILHFPSIPVCSKSCLGLCPVCGHNKNKEKCKCAIRQGPPENKPLSDLKKIYYGQARGS